jgi:hypothetical protein
MEHPEELGNGALRSRKTGKRRNSINAPIANNFGDETCEKPSVKLQVQATFRSDDNDNRVLSFGDPSRSHFHTLGTVPTAPCLSHHCPTTACARSIMCVRDSSVLTQASPSSTRETV